MINSSNTAIDEKSSNFSSSLLIEKNGESNKYLKSSNNRKKRRRKPKGKFCFGMRRNRKKDNMRKKIKSSFHKYIRLDINNNLKKAGSKNIFEILPQHFIADISKKTNFRAIQYTYADLFKFTYDNLLKDENYKKEKIK